MTATTRPRTLTELLQMRAERMARLVAFRICGDDEEGDEILTYEELDRRARAIGSSLAKRFDRGARIVISPSRLVDFIPSFFGAIYAGMIPVPASSPFGRRLADRLEMQVADAGAAAVVVSDSDRSRLRAANHPWLGAGELTIDGDPSRVPSACRSDDIAFLQYTSGSTSEPRGVIVTHANVLANEAAIQSVLGSNEDDVFGSWLPLFHDMGLIGSVLQPIFAGFPSVLFPAASFLGRPARWLEIITRYGVTTSGGPNFAFDLCVRRVAPEERERFDLRRWRTAFNGSEPVHAATLRAFSEAFAPCGFRAEAFFPCYGLAEATLFVAGNRDPGVDPSASTVSCGPIAPQTEVRIVDPATRTEVPAGEVGEIWVRGDSVARGYWNRPAESLVTFGNILDGERYLATGDLGLLHQGEIFVTGRIKDLVIVRGRNYYPHDIEHAIALLALPLEDGSIVAFGTDQRPGGGVVVVAESRVSQPPDSWSRIAQSIRSGVADAVGVAVDTVAFVRRGSLPKTTSGKPQRRRAAQLWLDGKIPVIWSETLESSATDALDRMAADAGFDIERELLREAVQIIGGPTESLALDAPLTALGFDSLQIATLAARFDCDLSIAEMFGGVTLRDLIRHRSMRGAIVREAPDEREAPAAPSQEMYAAAQLQSPGRRADNISMAFEVTGALDVGACRRALAAIIDRHAVLRTTVHAAGSGFMQRIHASGVVALECHQVASAEMQERIDRFANVRFDLSRLPLLRVAVYQHAGGAPVMQVAAHHAIVDLWSLMIFWRELWQEMDGGGPAIASAPFREFARAERARLAVDDEQFWRAAGERTSFLRSLGEGDPSLSGRGGVVPFAIDDALRDAVCSLAAAEHTTPFAVLLAAFQFVLRVHCDESNITTAIPFHGRVESRWHHTMGCFAKVLPLTTRFAPASSFRDVVRSVRDAIATAIAHHNANPLAVIDTPRRGVHTPLTQAGFSFQRAHLDDAAAVSVLGIKGVSVPFSYGGRAFRTIPPREWEPICEMFLALADDGAHWLGSYEYDRGSCDEVTARRVAKEYLHLLRIAVASPDDELTAARLMDDAERKRIIAIGTGLDVEADFSVAPELLMRHAAATPHAIALECGDRRMTYSELERLVNGLAATLVHRGVTAGDIVAVMLRSSIDSWASALAIWRIGAVYLPVDIDYPDLRRKHLIDDARPKVVIDEPLQVAANGHTLPPLPRAADDAYLLYTSGSTGVPKGARVPHRALTNVAVAQRMFGCSGESRVLQFASLGFDASIFELMLALGSGGTLVIPPDRFAALDDGSTFIDAQRITCAVLTPTVAGQLSEEHDYAALQTLIVAGEACPPATVQRWAGRCCMYNAYGPTEAGIWTTVEQMESKTSEPLIGRPIANTFVYVLDAQLRHVPLGAPGELCIGGDGLASGYHERADLTAQCFVTVGTERIYRTGDKVRWRNDAKLEFLGRIDRQVKLRGVRVELEEIEAVLRNVPGVAQAAAVLATAQSGEPQLVAVVVPSSDDAPSKGFIRQRLARSLPAAIVPQWIVFARELPMTAHGKVDTAAVRVLADAERVQNRATIPLSDDEIRIARAWSEVLHVRDIGPDDDLFELGAHSLNVARIAGALTRELGWPVPIEMLFRNRTPRALTAALRSPAGAAAPRAELRASAYPLTARQRDLWFLRQLDEHDTAYHMPLVMRFRGHLDETALAAAIRALARRHEALRCRIIIRGDSVLQLIGDEDASLEIVETPDPMTAIRAEIARPFAFDREPAFRTRLYRTGPDESLFLLMTHHLFCDGRSARVILEDLAAFYECHRKGEPLPPILPGDYRRYLERAAAASEPDLAFWRSQLAGGITTPSFDPDPDAADDPRTAGRFHLPLPDDATKRLLDFADAEGVSPFVVLMAAFAILIARQSNSEDVVIGTVSANRDTPDVDRVVGYLAATLPIRVRMSPRAGFRDIVAAVRRTLIDAQAHQEPSWSEMAHAAASASGRSLMSVLLVQNESIADVFRVDGVDWEPVLMESLRPKTDLLVSTIRRDTHLSFDLEYDRSAFTSMRIARLGDAFTALLDAGIARPAVPIDMLSALSPAERELVVHGFNQTARPYDLQRPLHALFEWQAELRGPATALRCEGATMSFGELEERANQLAHALIAAGAGGDQAIGVCMRPSFEMIVSLLAILKAGAAFVPLDPDAPAARLEHVIRDAGLRLAVTRRTTVENVVRTIDLDRDAQWIGSLPVTRVPRSVAANANAYILFTSGSTGVPKGAINTHRGIVNRIEWMQEALRLQPGERVLQKTSFTFDVSIWEIFWPLSFGGTVSIARPGGNRDAAYLARLIESEGISILHFVPSALRAFLAATGGAKLTQPARLVCSGEELTADLRDLVFATLDCQLHNLYGPTEAAIDVTHWHCTPGETRRRIPIGRPIANTEIYILDDARRPVPIGVPGEIWIGGVGVARGYIHQSQLTAQKFVPDAFGPRTDGTLYRSGDWGRWTESGAIEFLGRRDDQLKIRGFRVEPAEITGALARVGGTTESIVRLHGSDGERHHLVAYYVAGPATPREPSELRQRLREVLPDFMVPTEFVPVREMPRLASGKIDIRALPAARPVVDRPVHDRTMSTTERELLRLWKSVLDVDSITIDDPFFDVGGDSLLVMKLQGMVAEHFGITVPATAFFEHPTVAAFCANVLEGSSSPREPNAAESNPRHLARLKRLRERAY